MEETQAVTLEHVKRAAGSDRTCRSLVIAIREGFIEKKSMVREDLRPFYSTKEELYKVEEVPFLHRRLLIPGNRFFTSSTRPTRGWWG